MIKPIRTYLSRFIVTPIRTLGTAATKRYRAFVFVLTRGERMLFTGFSVILVLSLAIAGTRFYRAHTHLVPAVGGTYTEGIIGQPHLINPLFAAANDADRDIALLLFSGLMRYTPSGGLEPDLAETYEMTENGRVYTFTLRSDSKWHDGAALTADDVLFTINLIQNPRVESPLKTNWQGVKAERIDETHIRFTLESPYAPFLENTTLGILPKHLWERVPTENLRLAELNLQPVGSGPFRFDRFLKDSLGAISSYTLSRNPDAKPHSAYIKTFVFRFFASEDDLVKAFSRNDVDGFGLLTNRFAKTLQEGGSRVHAITLPRYFAVFFNQTSSKVLAEKSVRSALRAALDEPDVRKRLVEGRGVALDGPIPAGLEGFTAEGVTLASATSTEAALPPLDKARELLKQGGWKDSDGDGILERTLGKDKVTLSFTITTSDFADLKEDAQILQEAWKSIGANVELKFAPLAELERDVLRPRAYEALLFGEILSLEPDPFAFWHSSQKQDPGLNLAMYESRAADRLLEEARLALDKNARVQKLQEFSKLVQNDLPAIFLYTPYFFYPQQTHVSGFDMHTIALPAQRFADVASWYIKTDRVRGGK